MLPKKKKSKKKKNIIKRGNTEILLNAPKCTMFSSSSFKVYINMI